MGTYHPRNALALSTIPSESAIDRRGWGFYTVRAGSPWGIAVFVPGLSEL